MFSTLPQTYSAVKIDVIEAETQLCWNNRLHGSCKAMFITITDLITTIHIYPSMNC